MLPTDRRSLRIHAAKLTVAKSAVLTRGRASSEPFLAITHYICGCDTDLHYMGTPKTMLLGPLILSGPLKESAVPPIYGALGYQSRHSCFDAVKYRYNVTFP